VTFDESGFIRGVTFGGSGFIRGVTFGESGLMRSDHWWEWIYKWGDLW
jgi:hypothetical protein